MYGTGGGIGSWYSALFPDQVEKLISIDLISFGAMTHSKHLQVSRKSVLDSVNIGNKLSSQKIPTYNFAFMASNLINGLDSITKGSVEILMERGLVKVPGSPDTYTWSHDLRYDHNKVK